MREGLSAGALVSLPLLCHAQIAFALSLAPSVSVVQLVKTYGPLVHNPLFVKISAVKVSRYNMGVEFSILPSNETY